MAAAAAGWVRVESCDPTNAAEEASLQRLDDGEREAITLAIRLQALLIIDEVAGRAAATKLGVTLTGTLGVLVQAARRGLVPRLQTELDRLMVETNFRCADELIADALNAAGEQKP
jgi:predicted nucleic acid-binding protein